MASTPFPVATLLWQICKTRSMKTDTCESCYESFEAYNADVCKKKDCLNIIVIYCLSVIYSHEYIIHLKPQTHISDS